MNQITLTQGIPVKISTSNKFHIIKNTMRRGDILLSMESGNDHKWFPLEKGESFTFKKTLFVKQDTTATAIIPILKDFR